MTEEEMKEFIKEVNISLAHVDQLTQELKEHVEFISAKFMHLTQMVNG